MTNPAWLDTAVFYQIYPSSFYDSNRDGIGDLRGVIAKLGYLQSLGVNALWLNPCFDSPFQDGGYDISDYYRIAPRYGTNRDAQRLFAEAKKRGMRVLFDLVPGHTSIEHPWFRASCRHERNAWSDWYIWTDSGWTWDAPGLRLINGFAERDGAYATNFFYCQPALNYGFAKADRNHPWQQAVDAPGPIRVREEMRRVMRFWLDMGCSGFRVDMASSLVKNDAGSKETIKLWRGIRAWVEQEYPNAALISEWSNPALALSAGFHVDFLLHFGSAGYSSLFRKAVPGGSGYDPNGFSFFDPAGKGNIREFLDEFEEYHRRARGKGWIGLITGNHDITPRLSANRTTCDLELCFLFLLTMPGVPFVYYGDEIGMRTLEGLPSKEGGLSRTGSRTPMQWSAEEKAGFTNAPKQKMYLPIDPSPAFPNVADQERDPDSLLQQVRRIIALRHAHPALHASSGFRCLYGEQGKYPFVFERTCAEETLVVAINPAGYPVEVSIKNARTRGAGEEAETLYGVKDGAQRSKSGIRITLPAVSGGVYRIR